jgi:hypothetical protein
MNMKRIIQQYRSGGKSAALNELGISLEMPVSISYTPIYLYIYKLSTYTSIHLYVYTSIHLYIYTSIHLYELGISLEMPVSSKLSTYQPSITLITNIYMCTSLPILLLPSSSSHPLPPLLLLTPPLLLSPPPPPHSSSPPPLVLSLPPCIYDIQDDTKLNEWQVTTPSRAHIMCIMYMCIMCIKPSLSMLHLRIKPIPILFLCHMIHIRIKPIPIGNHPLQGLRGQCLSTGPQETPQKVIECG